MHACPRPGPDTGPMKAYRQSLQARSVPQLSEVPTVGTQPLGILCQPAQVRSALSSLCALLSPGHRPWSGGLSLRTMQLVLRPPSFRFSLSSSLCKPAVPCASDSQRRPAQAYCMRAAQPYRSWTEGPLNDRELKELVTSLHAWQEETRQRLEELEYWVSVMARQA